MVTCKVSPPVPAPVADCSWSSPTVGPIHTTCIMFIITFWDDAAVSSSVQFSMDLLRPKTSYWRPPPIVEQLRPSFPPSPSVIIIIHSVVSSSVPNGTYY